MSLILWVRLVVFGWLLGILINYLADVLPVRRRFSKPFCSKCNMDGAWFDYFVWPARCPHCHKQKSVRYWLVELALIAISLILVHDNPLPIPEWVGLLIFGYLLLVTVVDLEHRLILHATSLVGGVFCLGIGVWLHGVWATLLGALVGFGIMFGLFLFGIGFIRLLKNIRRDLMEEQEAIGFGDVILGGVIGLLLGWPGITMGVILAILIGGAVSLVVLVWNAVRKTYSSNLAVPYGPFLTISAFLLIFVRNWMT